MSKKLKKVLKIDFFQGVKNSLLKTPVCEVACEVVTTMGTLRG